MIAANNRLKVLKKIVKNFFDVAKYINWQTIHSVNTLVRDLYDNKLIVSRL